MILGSHNSLSYLPPKRWWMKPFAFMARCQRVDYTRQYMLGTRLFDLRVWFDKDGNIQVRHGRMLYDIDQDGIRKFLNALEQMSGWFPEDGCHCRIILEEDAHASRMPYANISEELFRGFCLKAQMMYPHVKFFGGNRKFDWRVLYDFGEGSEVSLDDKYSSTTSLFRSKKRWLAVLDDLFPYLYAKTHNLKNTREGTDKDCLFIDFVDIQYRAVKL